MWQAIGTELQPYTNPVGFLNSSPKYLADIWFILIVSYNLTDTLEKDSSKHILAGF